MFEEAGRLAENVMTSFEAAYLAVVAGVLSDASDELDLLGVALSAQDAAAVLLSALSGIVTEKAEPAVLQGGLPHPFRPRPPDQPCGGLGDVHHRRPAGRLG